MKLHMALGSRHVYQLTCNTERSGMLGDGSGVSEVGWRAHGNRAHSSSPASQSIWAVADPVSSCREGQGIRLG